LPPLDFSALGRLEFEEPRCDVFPALALARGAAAAGGAAPAVLNAANEVAVGEFLAGRIRFPQIWEVVAGVLERCGGAAGATLTELLEADAAARDQARALAAG
jgi:1-deoxy-D-xylulose-5-phosphate reductoisomerase